MENKLIVAIILLIASIFGVGHLIQPQHQAFKSVQKVDDYLEKFQEFQWNFGKVYNAIEEESKRFSLFKKAMRFIEQYNAKNNGVTLAMNQFGDLTDEEFSSLYLHKTERKSEKKTFSEHTIINRPPKIDWVGTLVNTKVYDQGFCSSFWAFSAVQGLEGAYAKNTGTFRQLSVQQLVDCVYPSRNVCKTGGEEGQAMEWVKKNGICAEETYPRKYNYTQLKCESSKCTPLMSTFEKVIYITSFKPQLVVNHISIAPVTVAMDGQSYVFRYYNDGIIKGNPSSNLNHAAIAVGYDDNESYIKFKNTWGEKWGEKGYFRVEISTIEGPGPLAVFSEPSYPHYAGEPEPTF